MTKLTTPSVVKDQVATQTRCPATILITEQQVLLGTAAAVPLPQRGRHVHTVGHMASAAVTWRLTRAECKHIRHDRPARLAFLEDSLMSREMYRL